MKSEMEAHNNSIHLIVQYYRCATPERQAEINTCLRNNLLNPYLTAIHLLTEEQFDLSQFPNADKIVQTVVGERLTFERAFQYANETDREGKWIWVLSNADIYFDETLRYVDLKNLDGVVYALTRHDVQPDGTLKLVDAAFAHGCQDAWIFRTPVPSKSMVTSFYMGVPGCDNRIAHELITAGFKVINPALLVKASHLDLVRTMDIRERDREYVSLMTEENAAKGLVASPPYQYHLYPVDQLNSDSPGMFRMYIASMNELARQAAEREQLMAQQAGEIERLGGILADTYGQVTELIKEHERHVAQLQHENVQTRLSYESSISWAITKPIRAIHKLMTGNR